MVHIRAYFRTLQQFSLPVRLYLISSGLFGFTVFGGIYTLLLNLYLLRLGYMADFVGVVNASGMLSLALFGVPAGMVGSRFGSRTALIIGLALIVAGLGLLPLAELAPEGTRPAWIVGTYMFAWIGVALYFVNTNPFLMHVTTPAERNHVFSVQAALWPVAGFAGSFVGGMLPGSIAGLLGLTLDSPAPYRYPLLLAALFLLPAVGALAQVSEPERHEPGQSVSTQSDTVPYRLILLLSAVTLLQLAGEGATRTFFNVYLDAALQVPTALIGTVMGTAQLLAVPAALMMPALAARVGNRGTIVAGSFGMAISLLPLIAIPHIGAAGLGFIGMTAMASIRRPAVSVYGMEIVPRTQWTAMSSATTVAVGLSWCLVALCGAFLITRVGYASFFLIAAGVTAVGAVLFWVAFRNVRS
jgi:MFS family permease